jgi:Mg-chelatase subunit ChlD
MFERIRSWRWREAGLLVLLLGLSAWAAHAGSRVRTAPPIANTAVVTPAIVTPTNAPRVEVAFVLDTTGSMAGLIDGAKRKIWSIANQLASGQPRPVVRMALIAYRDRGDAYVTQLFPLTDDIDAIYAHLQQLSADGGGDTPESVNQALDDAVARLSWSGDANVYRAIFLVGDAPPHMDYPDDVKFGRSVARARQKGIVINAVQCGDLADTTPVWQQIATTGGGTFAAIRQDGGMLALATPMDDELAKLNRDLASTLVPYGAPAEQAELEAKRDRAASAEPSAVASRLGFLSKLGGKLNAGRADLIDAIASGDKKLKDVPAPELPASLAAMPAAAREEFVEQKVAERQKIQAKIDSLSQERDAYVKQESERRAAAGTGKDGFDSVVRDAVRNQAAKAGITY